MQKNPKTSLGWAASIVRVPISTLRNRMNRVAPKRDSHDAHFKLVGSEEQTLANYILEIDEWVMAPRIDGVKK